MTDKRTEIQVFILSENQGIYWGHTQYVYIPYILHILLKHMPEIIKNYYFSCCNVVFQILAINESFTRASLTF